MSRPEIVDSHVHLIGDPARYPLRPTSLAGDSWVRTSAVDATEFTAMMTGAGVGAAVLVQPVGAYSDDNSYALDAAAADPERFAAVVMVDPMAGEPGERLRAHVTGGAAGLRMFAVRDTGDGSVDTPAYEPLWERAATLEVPVVVTLWTRQLPGLVTALRRHPGVTAVVDHCAFPDAAAEDPLAALRELAPLPGVTVKVTSHVLHGCAAAGGRPARLVADLTAAFGADRVAWGSDFPQTPHGSYRQLVDEGVAACAGLGDADRAAVLGGTARRLWWRRRPRVSRPAAAAAPRRSPSGRSL